MFGKAKGSSHEKDEPSPPAPQLQNSPPANLVEFRIRRKPPASVPV